TALGLFDTAAKDSQAVLAAEHNELHFPASLCVPLQLYAAETIEHLHRNSSRSAVRHSIDKDPDHQFDSSRMIIQLREGRRCTNNREQPAKIVSPQRSPESLAKSCRPNPSWRSFDLRALGSKQCLRIQDLILCSERVYRFSYGMYV